MLPVYAIKKDVTGLSDIVKAVTDLSAPSSRSSLCKSYIVKIISVKISKVIKILKVVKIIVGEGIIFNVNILLSVQWPWGKDDLC